MSASQLDPSASVYSSLVLRLYDLIVLTFSNFFAWRCSTHDILLPFFSQHIGADAHLDVGVGSGFYPAAAAPKLAKTKTLALMDLNPTTLAFAEARVRAAGYTGTVERAQQSVFDPLPASLRGRFDAVSLFYLLHCLPGSFPTKASHVLATVAPALAPGGVVYGATILGRDAPHNWLGHRLVRAYNDKGIFGNESDTRENLEKALRAAFEDVKVEQVGVVALFEARNPIPAQH
ncbi:S-adenosyl-L-methionine dependent methyltransferase [Obba rivulosa]|uniref:S-adenosyl-L-methionine dependent methyltransferase n=1 Tax=Obba rivulosa TaxID=1052685 RepID=A0A8E2B207_9APHY|nr:S-adenosyl-L-methionine dependent methyltransferase [Obba rivulosa]